MADTKDLLTHLMVDPIVADRQTATAQAVQATMPPNMSVHVMMGMSAKLQVILEGTAAPFITAPPTLPLLGLTTSLTTITAPRATTL